MRYIHKDIVKININFNELEDYREVENNNLPIHSFISLYRAIGLEKYIQEYVESTGKQIVAFDNLVCNFSTLENLKTFIKNQWKIYSIDIDADNHVFWKEDQYGQEKHYAKNLSSKVENSLSVDFFNFCPGEDDDLEENEIVFRVFEQVEDDLEEGENNEENMEIS